MGVRVLDTMTSHHDTHWRETNNKQENDREKGHVNVNRTMSKMSRVPIDENCRKAKEKTPTPGHPGHPGHRDPTIFFTVIEVSRGRK